MLMALVNEQNVDGFDQPTDLAKRERQRFLDDHFFRRMRLVEQALVLLQGCEYNGDLLSRSHISSNCEAMLMIGIFVAQHVDRALATVLLADTGTPMQGVPYIFVVEYAVEEYDGDLDPPQRFLSMRKHCFLAQRSDQVVRHECRLLNCKRRFSIARGWVADTRQWAAYVLPGPGGPVSNSTMLHHLDPDLCAVHHWIDSYDALDFDEIRRYTKDDSARQQRELAIHTLLGIRTVQCSCQFLFKTSDHTKTCTAPPFAPVPAAAAVPTRTPQPPPLKSTGSSPLSPSPSSSSSSSSSLSRTSLSSASPLSSPFNVLRHSRSTRIAAARSAEIVFCARQRHYQRRRGITSATTTTAGRRLVAADALVTLAQKRRHDLPFSSFVNDPLLIQRRTRPKLVHAQ